MKTKPATLIGAVLVLSLGLGGAAFAHGSKGKGPRGGGPEQMFEQFDADGDGAITAAEVAAATAAHFAEADSNADGFLSAEELAAQAKAEREGRMADRSERMLDSLDTNDDGKLSAEEMAARGPERMFDRLDANKDGTITRDELADAHGMKRGGWGKKGHGKRGDN